MNRFQNRNAVITGGSNGIGLATAQRISDEGGTVLVTGRDPSRLDVAAKVDRVVAVENDAAAPDAGTALRAAVDEHLGGRVDALFLNAGLGAFQPLQAIDPTEFSRQFDVNLRGPMLQLAALDPTLVDGGAVLFNTSVVNDMSMPGAGIYAATKGAVRSAMNVFSAELAGRSIRVNAVSPGLTLTDPAQADAQFFARADNLNNWLADLETRLGSLSRTLSESVGKASVSDAVANLNPDDPLAEETGGEDVKTSWTKIDDVFYEARGSAWALLHIFRAVEVDFRKVLQDKNAMASVKQIIIELEGTQASMWSPVILNGSGFGVLANPSLTMAAYLSRANAAISDMRDLLSRG